MTNFDFIYPNFVATVFVAAAQRVDGRNARFSARGARYSADPGTLRRNRRPSLTKLA